MNDTPAVLLLLRLLRALSRRALAAAPLRLALVQVLLELDVAQASVHQSHQILVDAMVVLLQDGQLPPATCARQLLLLHLFHLSGIFGVGGSRSLQVSLVAAVLLLLLLLLLGLGVGQALLVPEQLPLQAVVLSLEGRYLAPHLLIVDATHVVVLVVGRLEQQMALVPLQTDAKLALIREEGTVVVLHLVRIQVRFHDYAFVGGLLGVVAAERGTRQAHGYLAGLLVPQQVG